MAAAPGRGAQGGGIGPRSPSSQLASIPACPICLESFDPELSDVFSCCPCGHTFHRGCIRRWQRMPKKNKVLFRGFFTCPVCRAKTRLESVHQIHFNSPDDGGRSRGGGRGVVEDFFVDVMVEAKVADKLEEMRKRFNDDVQGL